jgi:hypothetical protein
MEHKLAVMGVDAHRNKAGKSFLAKGVSFKLDARGEIPVWLEAFDECDRTLGHLVGSAKMSVHDEVIWADVRLREDWLTDSLIKILYPHVLSRITRAAGDTIMEMVVDGINLSADEPLDGRIATLAVQGVRARRKE